jgi:hypothetical protein
MTAQRWTTEDIARELDLASREAARQLTSRWRKRGTPAGFPVGINYQTSERWYDAEMVTAAYDAMPGRGWRAGHTDTDHRGSTP